MDFTVVQVWDMEVLLKFYCISFEKFYNLYISLGYGLGYGIGYGGYGGFGGWGGYGGWGYGGYGRGKRHTGPNQKGDRRRSNVQIDEN